MRPCGPRLHEESKLGVELAEPLGLPVPVLQHYSWTTTGDNNNDIFFIGGDLDQIDFIENFYIFDRWGEGVYTAGQAINGGGVPVSGGDGIRFLPNDPAFGWDGMLNGTPLNPQVLVYLSLIHI